MSDPVTLNFEDGIARLQFNRPDKRNAMNPATHELMYEYLTQLENDPNVRVLIIEGTGTGFCAGMDLKEYFHDLKDSPGAMDRIRRISQDWRERKLRYFPAPTVARVHGYCFGGGISVVAACDLAIAADDTEFGLSEINFGTIPAGPVSKVINELWNDRDALWYILTGDRFTGLEAAEMKLVNKSVPPADLDKRVDGLAATLKEKNPLALRAAKELYRHSKRMDIDAALNFANTKIRELTFLQNGEWLDVGIGDFLEGKYQPGRETYKSSQ